MLRNSLILTLYCRKDAENEQFWKMQEKISYADLHAAHAYSILHYGTEHKRNIPYRSPKKKLRTKLSLNFKINKGISQPSLNSSINPEQFVSMFQSAKLSWITS